MGKAVWYVKERRGKKTSEMQKELWVTVKGETWEIVNNVEGREEEMAPIDVAGHIGDVYIV